MRIKYFSDDSFLPVNLILSFSTDRMVENII